MAGISLIELSKVYPDGTRAVDRVSLEIASGEFVVLVGPSGCGKSTLLRMIAGIEEVTEGSVLIGDRDVTDLPPRSRDVAMVFQNYALYPHLTVRENLGFGLKMRGTPKAAVRERVAEVAGTLGLDELLGRKPAALSGGQRQRVATGRAIVREPQAFLMDEPLSNLDAKLRVSMRAGLARLHERLGVTTVYVTHDQVEAMTLGQRVVVLRDGRIQQCDTPAAVFRRPANLFVAAFIGSPAMNLVEAELDDGAVRFAGHELPLPEADAVRGAEDRVILGIRPSDLELASPTTDPALPRLRARADIVEELGAESYVIFPVDAPPVAADSVRAAGDGSDEEALLTGDGRSLFTARIDSRHHVEAGTTIELAVHSSRLHFFDPASGDALTRTG